MIRYIRLAFLLALGICLIVVAFANRDIVTLRLIPEEMGLFLGYTWTIQLPLFVTIFIGIVAGLLIGFVWEWFREAKHRAAAATQSRQVTRLEREVSRLRKDSARSEDDDVLALLESDKTARRA